MIIHISDLNHEIFTLKHKDIVNEYKLLNTVRTYELNKSMVTLDLLKCKGVDSKKLDSMKLRLYYSNTLLFKRDSTYIVERYHELE